MTITSVGYQGTVGEAQWAQMVPRVGGVFYAVHDFASFRVTPAAGTRTAQVAPGGASCVGILDTSNAVETVTFSSVPSGERWDMVVLRRTWATKTTAVAVIQGGSTKALPTRNIVAGTVHDQPLALVRVLPGSSLGEIVDLRATGISGGAQIAFDDLARQYLSHVGTGLRIGNILWTRTVNASGSPVWTYVDVTPDTGWVDVTRNPAWGWETSRVRRIGGVIYLRLAASRPSWSKGNNLTTLGATFRPDAHWYVLSSATTGKTEFVIEPSGAVNASQNSVGSTGVTLYATFPAARPTD